MEYHHIQLLHVYFHTSNYYMSVSTHPTITCLFPHIQLLQCYDGVLVAHLFSFLCLCLRIKTMFGSPPVVCKRAHVLFTLFVFVCV